jgi:hypothetical protein
MLNRRAFLKRFGIGVAAACALASLPVSAVEALTLPEAGKRIACEYLRKIYNDWCQAHPGQRPTRMEAGQELFEAFEGELIAHERFLCVADAERGPRNLMFKAARLDCVGRGWQVRVIEARWTGGARKIS